MAIDKRIDQLDAAIAVQGGDLYPTNQVGDPTNSKKQTHLALRTFLIPLTSKGDIFTHDASVNARLAVGTNGQVLTADSAQTTGIKWATPSVSSGDVVGPAGATDHAIARFDTNTGKLIEDSLVIVDDSGNVSGIPTATIDTVQCKLTATNLTIKSQNASTQTKDVNIRTGNSSAADTGDLNLKTGDSASGSAANIYLSPGTGSVNNGFNYLTTGAKNIFVEYISVNGGPVVSNDILTKVIDYTGAVGSVQLPDAIDIADQLQLASLPNVGTFEFQVRNISGSGTATLLIGANTTKGDDSPLTIDVTEVATFKYTLWYDGVNLVARIEKISKQNEAKIYQRTVILLNTDVAVLNTANGGNGFELIPPQGGSTDVIEVISAFGRPSANGTAWDTNTDLYIVQNSATSQKPQLVQYAGKGSILEATSGNARRKFYDDTEVIFTGSGGSEKQFAHSNTNGIMLWCPTGNPLNGTFGLKIYLTYRVVTL